MTEQVRQLIKVLEGPAPYINIPLRKLTNFLLLAIQRLDKEFVFDLPKRTFRPLHQALPSGEWPKNVRAIEDLQDSVSSTELSNDAREYLYKMLSPINNFQIQYDGGFAAVHSDPLTMKPIKIIVSPSDGAAVRELIETSTKARLVNLVEGPKDFIDVIEDPKLMGLLKEEGFFTTGSPWKNGTLGCLMKCQDKVYGITCKHVNRTILNTDSPAHHLLCQEVESDGDTFIDACDQKTDFSFFQCECWP